MQVYHINDLERITGIKAHTLRIWEKRYGIIIPHRTSTNRRCYNDSHVRRLLNISTLLGRGHKISGIAALPESELNAQVEAAMPPAITDNIGIAYLNDLTAAMLVYDEPAFEKVFAAAVLRLGLHEAMLQVGYPLMQKIGAMWSVDKTTPAQEHFATCIINRKLAAATDGLTPPDMANKKFLLFLPPDEWHETGLLFANYLLRHHGHPCIYLGQNVPYDMLVNVINQLKPDFLLTFYIAARPQQQVKDEINTLKEMAGAAKILIAGSSSNIAGAAGAENVFILSCVQGLLDFIAAI